MKKITKIKNLVIGLAMLVFAVLLFLNPTYGPPVIIALTAIGLLLEGISSLIFYCTMAVHMTGGRKLLFRSILILDLGAFLLTGFTGSSTLIMMYLMGFLAVSGGISIIRALESKKEGAPWKGKVAGGAIAIAAFIVGSIFMSNPLTMVIIFCLGLLYSGINRIVNVFRKTAVIYIPE
jgi:uncharacterized membrane protein HdeD (DUF308 family)